jgi:hypothetical protein
MFGPHPSKFIPERCHRRRETNVAMRELELELELELEFY